MNDPEFQQLVAEWLGEQVYSRVPKLTPYRGGKPSKNRLVQDFS